MELLLLLFIHGHLTPGPSRAATLKRGTTGTDNQQHNSNHAFEDLTCFNSWPFHKRATITSSPRGRPSTTALREPGVHHPSEAVNFPGTATQVLRPSSFAIPVQHPRLLAIRLLSYELFPRGTVEPGNRSSNCKPVFTVIASLFSANLSTPLRLCVNEVALIALSPFIEQRLGTAYLTFFERFRPRPRI